MAAPVEVGDAAGADGSPAGGLAGREKLLAAVAGAGACGHAWRQRRAEARLEVVALPAVGALAVAELATSARVAHGGVAASLARLLHVGGGGKKKEKAV